MALVQSSPWVTDTALSGATPLPHFACARLLAGGAELAFCVREDDLYPPVLRTAALGGVGLHRVLVAIAFDLDAFFVDPQVHQHIGHRLRAVAGQLKVFLLAAGAVGVTLDTHYAFGVQL